jgi:hypothetical protein
VYSPTQNRIYLVPYVQAPESLWHYIDCNTDLVVDYAHDLITAPVNAAYIGGVYSPTQNRIYLIPATQAAESLWHYIDCNTGLVEEYAHNLITAPLSTAYYGGVYSPTQNRIYLVPFVQAPQSLWHYIDCNTDLVVEYAHNLITAPVNYAYYGGVYSPTQNRIYLVPSNQANAAGKNWHYIEDYSGEPVSKSLMAGAIFNKL